MAVMLGSAFLKLNIVLCMLVATSQLTSCNFAKLVSVLQVP